jgi:hypothetical protein
VRSNFKHADHDHVSLGGSYRRNPELEIVAPTNPEAHAAALSWIAADDAEIERIRFSGRSCTVLLTDGSELDLRVSEYSEAVEPLSEDSPLWSWCDANQGALMQALSEVE